MKIRAVIFFLFYFHVDWVTYMCSASRCAIYRHTLKINLWTYEKWIIMSKISSKFSISVTYSSCYTFVTFSKKNVWTVLTWSLIPPVFTLGVRVYNRLEPLILLINGLINSYILTTHVKIGVRGRAKICQNVDACSTVVLFPVKK